MGTYVVCMNVNPFARSIPLPLMYRVYLQHINTTNTGEKMEKRQKQDN